MTAGAGTTKKRVVSVSRVIAADSSTIFSIIDNPSRHAEMDGSGTVRSSAVDQHLTLGDRFSVAMKLGVPYRMSSKVVEYEKDRLIAWAHYGGHRWRYELEPVEGGTRVTESFDWSYSRFPKGIEIAGYPTRHPAAMSRTLERLEALATG